MNRPQRSTPDVPAYDDAAETRLEALLQRIHQLNGSGNVPKTKAGSGHPKSATSLESGPAGPLASESLIRTSPPARSSTPNDSEFIPKAPTTFDEAKIAEPLVEELIYKFLLACGEASIREISNQVRLQFHLCEQIIKRMKNEQMLGYHSQAAVSDYRCRLTDQGRDRAKRFSEICAFFGAAPVAFHDYVESVKAQTITKQHPSENDLKVAFQDLLINPDLFRKLGPAINSGRGMFLYGYPGNGKTSIAERITAAFGKYIWVPRPLIGERDIIRVFDPTIHELAPEQKKEGILADDEIDHRWVKIKRPTIVVGGELRLEHLEIQYNSGSGTSEAPVQMKSNCGVLVIDDFGRQQITVSELLNRWIVPLEKRYDFLNTTSGKKIQVPFDQLVIFSTNLEPRDLVDDAFLRRIPYKIEVPNPPRADFVKLFEIMCGVLGCEFKPDVIEYLIETHYVPNNRPFRNCHPRDLLMQVKNLASYRIQPFELTTAAVDFAVENYFSIM
ncbi:MAG TPA: AAA family ATPase [Pirellulaceae bacterium]|nr:AAA family ATPase [Pirellulaceae bacterium]